MAYWYLAIAIIAEVVATSALKASAEFTKLQPSLIVIVGYAFSFYFMTLTLRTIPLGITYAIWSGVGLVLVTIAGVFLYEQVLNIPTILGMCLAIFGVVVIHIFSKSIN